MKIADAKIIITGAGAGFGKQMAIDFHAEGAEIFAIDINTDSLENLQNEFPAIHTFKCDVSDSNEVETCINQIFARNSKTNVLINNAGIMKNEPLLNMLSRGDKKHSLELWNKVIAVNQNAVFYTTRCFAEKMLANRNKGVIVNISSISARGNIGQTAYSASKAAVEAMTKVWAKELGRLGIRAIAIAPGFMDTAGTHDAVEEKMLAQWIEKTPLRRTGTINEVVKTVQFAIENDFVTGEVLNVNGGLII